MDKCPKCFSRLSNCRVCKGQGYTSDFGNRLTCKTCNNTGKVCSTHGGLWEK